MTTATLHIDTLPCTDATQSANRLPIVLLHGWGMHGQVWGDFANQLSSLSTVHVVDLPGHGHSAHTSPFDLATISETIRQTLNFPALWVGWSLGGMVAQQVALTHPDQVKGLCLIASSPCFAMRDDWPSAMKPDVLAQFTQALGQDAEGTLQRFLALQAMGIPSAKQQAIQLRQLLASRPLAHPQTLSDGLTILRDVDLRAQLSAIQCPIELIYGERDALVPAAAAHWLANALPSARLHLLAQSAHAPFLTHPDVCLDAIEHLLLQA